MVWRLELLQLVLDLCLPAIGRHKQIQFESGALDTKKTLPEIESSNDCGLDLTQPVLLILFVEKNCLVILAAGDLSFAGGHSRLYTSVPHNIIALSLKMIIHILVVEVVHKIRILSSKPLL